jgi:hypothetical protein
MSGVILPFEDLLILSLVSSNVVMVIVKGANSFKILVDSLSLFSGRKSLLFNGSLLGRVLSGSVLLITGVVVSSTSGLSIAGLFFSNAPMSGLASSEGTVSMGVSDGVSGEIVSTGFGVFSNWVFCSLVS